MKTAVILSGHIRTWDLIKETQVDALETIYGKDLDWYISVWDTNTVTKEYMLNFFSKRNLNLINLNWVNTFYKNTKFNVEFGDDSHLSNWSGNFVFFNYLRSLSSLDKKKHEFKNGIVYDRVIFTRPDLLLFYTSKEEAIESENYFFKAGAENEFDFCLQLRGDFNDTSYPISSPSPSDIRTIAGSLSSDLIGMMPINFFGNHIDQTHRLQLRKGADAHSLLSLYVKDHYLTVDNRYSMGFVLQHVRSQVVRPTMDIDLIKKTYDKWTFEDNFEPGYCDKWLDNRTNDKNLMFNNRIKACIEKNIDLADYDLEKFLSNYQESIKNENN